MKKQSGSLFIPLPAGTVITSNQGERSWTLAKPSESVVGPDKIESSRFEFVGDDKPFVLSRERSSSQIFLALVPVDTLKASRVRGEVLPVLVEPLVFLPVDFAPETEHSTSHRNAVKMLWASAPASVRRDLVAEENVRSMLMKAPTIQADMLLWLLGCSGLESCLPRMGMLCPNGSAGAVMCRRANQQAQGDRALHCILAPPPGSAKMSRVRICLRYTLGNATFEEIGEEYRELSDATADESELFSCKVDSPFLAFAGVPAQFETRKMVFAFPADRNGKGEGRYAQADTVINTVTSGWRLLKEKDIVQDLLLQAVWSSLPRTTRKSLGKFVKLDVSVKDVADQTGRALSAALRNDRGRLGDFYHRLFLEALERWNYRSVFSRLSDALASGAPSSDGIFGLRALLTRSYRNFVLSLSRLLPNDPENPCAAGDESVCYKQLAKLVEETVPIFTVI